MITQRSYYPWPVLEPIHTQVCVPPHPPSVVQVGHLFELEPADIQEIIEYAPRGPRMESTDEYFSFGPAHTSPIVWMEMCLKREARASGFLARYVGLRHPGDERFVPPPNFKILCRNWFIYTLRTGSPVYAAYNQGPIRPLGPRYDLYATIQKANMRLVYFTLPTSRYQDRIPSTTPGAYTIARHVARMGRAPPVASHVPDSRRPFEGTNDYLMANLPYLFRDNIYASSRINNHLWYHYHQTGKAPYLGRLRGPFRQPAPPHDDEWPQNISHGETTWLATLNTTKRGVIRIPPEEIDREREQDPPFSYLVVALTRAGVPFLFEQPAHLIRTLVGQVWAIQKRQYDVTRILSAITCPDKSQVPHACASIALIRNYLEKHALSPVEKVLLCATRITHAAITHRAVIDTLAEAGVPSREELGTVPKAWDDIYSQQKAFEEYQQRGCFHPTIRPPRPDNTEQRLLAIPDETYPWILTQLRAKPLSEMPPRDEDWALILYHETQAAPAPPMGAPDAPDDQPPYDPRPSRGNRGPRRPRQDQEARYGQSIPLNSYYSPRRGRNRRPYNGPRYGRDYQSTYNGPTYGQNYQSTYNGPKYGQNTPSTYTGPLYGMNNPPITTTTDNGDTAAPSGPPESTYNTGGWTPPINEDQAWIPLTQPEEQQPPRRHRSQSAGSPVIRPRLQEPEPNARRTPSTQMSGGGEDNPVEVSSSQLSSPTDDETSAATHPDAPDPPAILIEEQDIPAMEEFTTVFTTPEMGEPTAADDEPTQTIPSSASGSQDPGTDEEEPQSSQHLRRAGKVARKSTKANPPITMIIDDSGSALSRSSPPTPDPEESISPSVVEDKPQDLPEEPSATPYLDPEEHTPETPAQTPLN